MVTEDGRSTNPYHQLWRSSCPAGTSTPSAPNRNPDPGKCSGCPQERCQVHRQLTYLILLTYLSAALVQTPLRCSTATPNSQPGCADSAGDLPGLPTSAGPRGAPKPAKPAASSTWESCQPCHRVLRCSRADRKLLSFLYTSASAGC